MFISEASGETKASGKSDSLWTWQTGQVGSKGPYGQSSIH